MPPLLRCAGRPRSADSRPLRCPLDGRAGDVRMSDHRRYQPPNDEVDEFCRRLRELMGSAVVAICAHAPELAVVIACRLDAGEWRLRTNTDLDDDGEPDPETLWFHVAVELDNDGWLPLCGAH